jgi:hypothetical protein
VTDPPTTPAEPAEPVPPVGQAPGERRLAHPPSDRYRVAEAAAVDAATEGPDPDASVARGLVFATLAAVGGAAAILILGGVLTLTAGLVVVAAVTGWAVAQALRVGAGQDLTGGRRAATAVAIALAAVALGQLLLWLYARTEGGVLPIGDYLAETFGILVPVQAVAACLAAWVTAR